MRCVAEHRATVRDPCTTGPTRRCSAWCRARSTRTFGAGPRRAWPALDFDGFGIGGALEKDRLGTIVRWVCEELPDDRPRHLLGIGEPDDVFTAIENGADTFDCVAPSRNARNGTVFHPKRRFHLTNGGYRRDFTPIDDACDCYTCTHHTRAYVHHLFKAKEMLASHSRDDPQ